MAIILTVYPSSLEVTRGEHVVEGSIRANDVEFRFRDNAWDGMALVAAFETMLGTRGQVLGEERTCQIPWEVIDWGSANSYLKIGLYGVKEDDTGIVVRDTVWATMPFRILPGPADIPEFTQDPTPTQYQQMLAQTGKTLAAGAEVLASERAVRDLTDKAYEHERQAGIYAGQAGDAARAVQMAQEAAQQSAAAAADYAASAEEFALSVGETATNAEENAARIAEQIADSVAEAETIKNVAQDSATAAANSAVAAANSAQEAANETAELLASYVRDSEAYSTAAANRATEAADSAAAAEQAARQAALGAASETEAQLASYVSSGEAYAEAAADSAAAAEQSARSVNADEWNTRIDAKGDNLEFDSEEGLLYLTSGGERIGDGIRVATSGGGGGTGGESNNAVLTLKNTTGWIHKTVSVGAACPISFEWSSLEEGLATGSGVLKISVADTVKYTGQIEQGAHTVDVGPYLTAGNSTVKLNMTDVYGNSRSLSFNLTAVELTLTSTFDAGVPYTGDITFPYTPTATVEKTVHFKVDGAELPTATVTASGRQLTYTIPAQSHGCHQLEVWFEASVDGEPVESNRLYYALICTEEGNTTPIIAVDWRIATVEQFATLSIPYIVYDPASLTASVQLHSSETGETKTLTVDRTGQTWSYRTETAGELTLTLGCVGASGTGTSVSIVLTVAETTLDVTAETENLSLYLTSYGRSNNEANPGVWNFGSVAAQLTGFNYTSDGWMQDADGITVLRVGGDARVEIPVQIFAKDFRTTGKTIEIEFASRSVLDYDAVIATCWTGERGFEITAQQAVLKSEKSEVTTDYKEDDHLRLSYVIEKRSGNRLIIAYVNGIISGMVQYPDNDDFSQAVPVNITLGSNDCTLDIYNIRVYENDLTRFQILDNWIADTQELAEKKDRYDRNNIFDDYGRILPGTLRPHQCYLVLNCPVLPTYKGDKKTCSGQYVDPVHPERSFTFTNAQIDVQGTSSQYYYVKNFKNKFKGGFTRGGQTSPTYAMNDNAVPTNEFTFKADVASSEGANNVVLAELYNDLCPVKTPAQEDDPRVRQTIEGHPIVVFHDDGSGAKFIGKYNFNNDKGTPEVFGFTDGDESWEILENGNALVSFKSADFTNWKTSFEARYPEDNTDIARLQQFVAWVASTDTTAAGLTEDDKAARLQKFKDEIADWASVEDAIFYYLFTLIFLCIDQREKNAFPTWNAEMAKWLWLFYDADSSLGTDNKGNLTFEYWMEDIDFTEAGDPVFNGQNNVFWTNLRLCFAEEIRDEYRRLRTELAADGKPLLSYDRVNGLFTAHQSQWSEAIYNEDAWRKAVEPLEKANDPQYLPMQQGKKEQHFKHWTYNRFRYMDSKFETGAALDEENRIMMRAHAQGNIFLTSYINMYGQVYFNAARAEHRMVRDQEYEFEWNAQGAEDAVIGVNSAPMITSLGDLSPLMLEYCHIQYATRLTELKVGDDDADYENDNFVALTLGNNTLLRKLDVRNCTALTQTVDASGCTNIEEVYFDGTAITGVILPNGGILKKLHLPGTVTDLTICNQPMLAEFILPGYGNITTLHLENVPSVVPAYNILTSIPANSRVRLLGVDWSFDSAQDILTFYDYLDTMRGLDEQGNNVDKPQISGTIRVDSLDGAQLAEMRNRYPDIRIVYQNLLLYVYYKDWDGTLLHTAACIQGADAQDPVADGTIESPTRTAEEDTQYQYAGWGELPINIQANVDVVAQYTAFYRVRYYNDGALWETQWVEEGTDAPAAGTPTKESTAQYHYTFSGWDSTLTDILAPLDVSAVYTETIRTYTVRFYNGDTLLQTVENVPYGSTATYTGDTPVNPEDASWSFEGFEPEPTSITEDTDCFAQYKEPFSFKTATWAEISEISKAGEAANYFALGDSKEITFTAPDGNSYTMAAEIIAFNQDVTVIRTTAGITMKIQYVAGSAVVQDPENNKGWGSSALRTTLNTTTINSMDSELQSVIKSVKKLYTYNDGTNDVQKTTHDRLWLFTYAEFGWNTNGTYDFSTTDGTRYPGFGEVVHTTPGGTATAYWTRTGPNGVPNAYGIVAPGNKFPRSISSLATSGVLFGFCV